MHSYPLFHPLFLQLPVNLALQVDQGTLGVLAPHSVLSLQLVPFQSNINKNFKYKVRHLLVARIQKLCVTVPQTKACLKIYTNTHF